MAARLNSEGACWVLPTRWRYGSAVRLSVRGWRTDPAATDPAATDPAVAAFLAVHRAERRPGQQLTETP